MESRTFLIEVLEYLISNLPTMQHEKLFRRIIAENPNSRVNSRLVIELIEMIAPRFNCDLTQPLPRYDDAILAKQTGIALLRFTFAHARHCQTCTPELAGAFVYGRFINTYLVRSILGTLPPIPNSDLYFYESDQGSYLEGLPPDHIGRSTAVGLYRISGGISGFSPSNN